jgi:hypothetical protein
MECVAVRPLPESPKRQDRSRPVLALFFFVMNQAVSHAVLPELDAALAQQSHGAIVQRIFQVIDDF